MNVEKEVTESTQTDNNLIETGVKKALECLYISSDQRMTEESDFHMNNKSRIRDNVSSDGLRDRTKQNHRLNSRDKNSVDSSSTVTANKLKSDPFLSSTIDKNNISIEDQVSSSESSTEELPESKTCKVSESEIIYVNAVFNEILGKPLANRYPLKCRWQLWFWRAKQGIKVVWEEALQQVCKPFDTIEDFWRLYHHIICVEQLGIK